MHLRCWSALPVYKKSESHSNLGVGPKHKPPSENLFDFKSSVLHTCLPCYVFGPIQKSASAANKKMGKHHPLQIKLTDAGNDLTNFAQMVTCHLLSRLNEYLWHFSADVSAAGL